MEGRHLAAARPRDGILDEDGDPIISSRAVEFREFNDDARCLPCVQLGRACHVREGSDACMECVITSTSHECLFTRKVMRRERMTWFHWTELTGAANQAPRNHLQHSRDGSGPHYPDALRPVSFGTPYSHPPAENQVERAWNAYQQPQYPPNIPPQQTPLYNGPMPPPKRQRTEMYDGQDVFAQHRPPLVQSGPISEWQEPRRPEYHLPQIRPHEGAPPLRKPEESALQKDERPLSAPQERNGKILDLKPPSAPMSLKRKIDPEPVNETIPLPHRCSKCDASFKTPAELKKHFARHEPQYFCNIPGCSRGRDGFTTKNDLDRHRKTMHKILSPNDRFWKCFYPDCAKTEKVWPRLDNFKAHIVRMHGAQYVAENVSKAEEWWDSQKTPMIGRSPETTHDLVAIEPKPLAEPSRLGVTNLLADQPLEAVNGRRRHLSAEGRQEAAQVREMGACLRCALLKEKCDDNKVCHRCKSYDNKHTNGTLICRRGQLNEILISLIPFFDRLPLPDEGTKGFNLRLSSPPLRLNTFSDLLRDIDMPGDLQKTGLRKNSFTLAVFRAMDDVVHHLGKNAQANVEPEHQAEVEALRQFREVCCLVYDCILDVLETKPEDVQRADLREKLQRTNVELREWYDELDNAVFDWRSRTLELSHNPWKKWNLFFAICAMFVMERLTVTLSKAWVRLTGYSIETGEDEAADTLCALLEFKFLRQAPAQNHFITMLLDDKHETTQELRDSLHFLRESKGFETWRWLYDQFGEAESNSEDRQVKTPDSDDSDTMQAEQHHQNAGSNSAVKSRNGSGSSQTNSRVVHCCKCDTEIEHDKDAAEATTDVECSRCKHKVCDECLDGEKKRDGDTVMTDGTPSPTKARPSD